MSPVPQTDPSYKNISQETVQATIFSTNLQPLPFPVRENPSPTSIAWLWAIIKRFCSSYTPSLRVVAAWRCILQGGPLLFINAAPATNQNAPVHEPSQKEMYLPTNCAPVRGASGPLLPTGPMVYQLFNPDVIFQVGPNSPRNSTNGYVPWKLMVGNFWDDPFLGNMFIFRGVPRQSQWAPLSIANGTTWAWQWLRGSFSGFPKGWASLADHPLTVDWQACCFRLVNSDQMHHFAWLP